MIKKRAQLNTVLIRVKKTTRAKLKRLAKRDRRTMMVAAEIAVDKAWDSTIHHRKTA